MQTFARRARYGAALTIALAAFLSSATSLAVPIDYYFTGNGTGILYTDDGSESYNIETPFTDADFVIHLSADTDDIEEFEPGTFDVVGPSTIDLDGVGLATFLVDTRVFSCQLCSAVGFSHARPIGSDLVDLFDDVFATYALDTPIGPILETDPEAVSQFFRILTTLGQVTFSDIDVVTFQAVMIPEPAAALLLLIGGAAWQLTPGRSRRTQDFA